MGGYIMDLTIIALLIVGITATVGVITNGIGTRFFSGNKRNEFVNQSTRLQNGWKNVGGSKK